MKIQISAFTLIYYALLLLFCHNGTIVAYLSAVLVHETAHLILIVLCGCTIECIQVTPIGISIRRSGLTGHLQDVAIHLAGPAINFFMAIILSLSESDTYALPIASNLFFGLLNLLPIESLDGSKVLSAILSVKLSEGRTAKLCRMLSNLSLLICWMLSAATLLMLDGSPSLLIFCITLFLAKLQNED